MLGSWHISIQGTGPHHHKNYTDADRIAQELLDKLKDSGQTIVEASFTYGGALNLNKEKRKP